MTRRYSDAEFLDALRAFAADHDGRAPTVPEANDGLPSATAFTCHFGTWNAAVEAADLDVRNRHRTDEELLADLRALGSLVSVVWCIVFSESNRSRPSARLLAANR